MEQQGLARVELYQAHLLIAILLYYAPLQGIPSPLQMVNPVPRVPCVEQDEIMQRNAQLGCQLCTLVLLGFRNLL